MVSNSIIIEAFDALGGDPSEAVESASSYASTDSWINVQAAQVGVAGATAMAIPGMHLIGMAADMAFLMHKLAYTCWGIGEIKKCVVLGKDDFANILALWSGAASLAELDRRAISKAAFETAAIAGGGTVAGLSVAAIAANLTGQQIAMFGGQVAGSLLAKKAAVKTASKASVVMAGRMGSKLGGKLASKVAAKFSTKLGAKAFSGIIPLIGPAVGAGVNVYFIRNIAKSAIRYYESSV
jgi:hypothetical protein